MVAMVLAFVLRARTSVFALMRAIVAPLLFADYLILMTWDAYQYYVHSKSGGVSIWKSFVNERFKS
jgi:hypothetical protein